MSSQKTLGFPEILKIWVFKVSFALNFHSTSELPSRTFALFFGIVQEPFGMHCSVIKVPYVICVTAYDSVSAALFPGELCYLIRHYFPCQPLFGKNFGLFFEYFSRPIHTCVPVSGHPPDMVFRGRTAPESRARQPRKRRKGSRS